MINVPCPNCGHEMKFKDVAAGRVVKCSQCEAKVRVPSADMIDSDTSPVEPRRRGPAKEPDRRLDKRLRLDDRDRSARREPAHTPEWALPAVLIAVGLVLTLVGVGLVAGAVGVAAALIYVSVELVISVPLGIACMFLIAPLLGVSFGTLGLAILRLAAISVFTIGIVTTSALGGWGLTGYLLAVPIGYFLFSHFFDLSLFETMVSLFIMGLVQKLVGLLLTKFLLSRLGE